MRSFPFTFSVSPWDTMGDDVLSVKQQMQWKHFLLLQGASWLHFCEEHDSCLLRRGKMAVFASNRNFSLDFALWRWFWQLELFGGYQDEGVLLRVGVLIILSLAQRGHHFEIAQVFYFFASLGTSEMFFPPSSSFPSTEIAHILSSETLATFLSLEWGLKKKNWSIWEHSLVLVSSFFVQIMVAKFINLTIWKYAVQLH